MISFLVGPWKRERAAGITFEGKLEREQRDKVMIFKNIVRAWLSKNNSIMLKEMNIIMAYQLQTYSL